MYSEARSRLDAKQAAKLDSQKAEARQEEHKRIFTMGKLMRSMSSKSKEKDTSGLGARVAYQVHPQERASSDPRNEGSRLEAGKVYTPQEPEKKKRVEKWLDGLDQGEGDEQNLNDSKLWLSFPAWAGC